VASEAEFWDRYVEATNPLGKASFGRNLDAFWDAVEGGGPGWPGDVALIFKNAASLAALRDGRFLAALEKIASETSTSIAITP
jgi:hypothetical protein